MNAIKLVTCSSLLLIAGMTSSAQAGPTSGRFDINSVDCNNLQAVNKRFRRMAERKCAENKPSYTISNRNKVASEPTPPDVYAGKDKEKFRSMIASAWKNKYPQDKVLGIRFHSDHWVRNSAYNTNATGLYKTDTSVLPVSVIVQSSSTHATIFPAYINRNNLSGAISAGVDTKKKSYVVKEMLLSNWKP
ncbi:hypothetical protein [Thiolapillus brandeum]|uniref:Uncharacterized protein n=1 Tax=Thiolapillus brandeum TaxID=1076588 RepID=A0A7U6GGN9_9GAMM|nr:hypothetical protein [Thiolapillus brandeum]BAO43310.1 hypothetical protein TBH_C0364 [Thiolapillus brandeum]